MLKKFFLAFMDHFESYICQCLLVFFVVTIFMQIILRAIDQSLYWTEEIARFAFIWFILFGASYATRLSALNRVTMQFNKFPPIVSTVCIFIGDVFWLFFSITMAWYGYKSIVDLAEFPYYTAALDWNLAYVYLIFPIAFSLMAIRIIQVNVIKFVLHKDIEDPDQAAIEESRHVLADKGEDV